MSKHTISDLYQMQSLPLDTKIKMTKERIRQWIDEYGEDGVYESFSGDKDSTVLLHLIRQDFPNIKAVFSDTGLEFAEIRDFVKTIDNVDWIRPKMTFKQVVEKYGFAIISKEVAECVYGARKYLTSLAEKEMLDRPTDRPAIFIPLRETLRIGPVVKDKRGGVRQQVPQTQGNLELLRQMHEQSEERHIYHFETDKLLGTCRYGKQSSKQSELESGGWSRTMLWKTYRNPYD